MTSRRLPLVLLLVYIGFVVYGSFFPFDFTYDPERIRRFLDHPLPRLHDADGRRLVSLPDVVSNVLLGVPLGVLMVWGGLAGGSLTTGILRVALADGALALAVELGQLFAPSRTSSPNDVIAQVVGALAGLLAAHALAGTSSSPSGRPLGPRLAEGLGRRPALALGLALAVTLAADALYPYAVTLDVSTVWHNLRSAQWRPLAGLRHAAFWPDLVVERVLPYALLGGLARIALAEWVTRGRGVVGWAGVTALAAALEVGKVFIQGRAPSVDSVLLAAAGALVGVSLVPRLTHAVGRARLAAGLIAGAAALLVYEELTPFSVVHSAAAVRARLARVEWLPFASYYFADPQSALFDFGKKLLLGAALGAAMRHASPRPRLILVLGLAALLEAAQVFQPVHIASVGDALVIYVGARVGAYLVERAESLPHSS